MRYDRLMPRWANGQHAGGLRAQELPPTRIGVLERCWRDPVAAQDPPDRRGADSVAELEQLALNPAVAPARVLPRHMLHQRGDDVVDGWSSGTVQGPLFAHEMAMPVQDGVRSDQAMPPQCLGQPSDHRAASTARSAQSRRGPGWVRRSTAISWRSTWSSTSLLPDLRHDSRTNPHLPEDQVQ